MCTLFLCNTGQRPTHWDWWCSHQGKKCQITRQENNDFAKVNWGWCRESSKDNFNQTIIWKSWIVSKRYFYSLLSHKILQRSSLSSRMCWRQCAEVQFEESGCDDVLVRLPVFAVKILEPFSNGLHLGIVRELTQRLLAGLAAVQQQPPVFLSQCGESHGKGLPSNYKVRQCLL